MSDPETGADNALLQREGGSGREYVDLAIERALIDSAIEKILQNHLQGYTNSLTEPITYALRGPGKRLRGILVNLAYRAAGGLADSSLLAAAVEIIHTYSLVHDDLPCMDNDSVRRGRPTAHVVYGVPFATTAGVAMLPLAVRAIKVGTAEMTLNGGQAAIIVEELLRAAGAGGMVGGQLRDLRAEGVEVTRETLEAIHRSKTGALIVASARIGGIAAGANADQLEALERYGADLGLAFQIVDDILDVTSTTDQLGKTAGKDLVAIKSTYPALLGVEGATSRAHSLIERGCSALADVGLLTPALEQVASLVITRKN